MLGQIFSQTYNLTKGVKKFVYKGSDFALAEFEELYYRLCFRTIIADKITSQECK